VAPEGVRVGVLGRRALAAAFEHEPVAVRLGLRQDPSMAMFSPISGFASAKLRRQVIGLDLIGRLRAYGHALSILEQQISTKSGHTFLLELDLDANTLRIQSYGNALRAAEEYAALERAVAEEDARLDVVLVA